MILPTQRSLDALLSQAETAILAAISEDAPLGDPTSESVFPRTTVSKGIIRAKEPGVIAGLPVAQLVFEKVCPGVCFKMRVADGQEVITGDVIADVAGPTRDLLRAERVALNFLQRMSGIATLTRQYVDAVSRSGATILDTRKTVPGLRSLDKYAVRAGGGENHRLTLSDLAMIKDNHIDAAGSIAKAFRAIRRLHPTLSIEIEVRSLEELDCVLQLTPLPERVLLDNMDLNTLREAVLRIDGRIYSEASGGITLKTAADIASTGVNSLSVGALTHSPRALDLSMTIDLSVPGTKTSTIEAEIRALRHSLGHRITILGHHYVRDDVLQFADLRGDSLKLAQEAAKSDAEFIVVCGVHFMGETAALLAAPHQTVILPLPSAGCYLADCVDVQTLKQSWTELQSMDPKASILPLAYVNSSLEVKAFCGERGGATCTSANAETMLKWAFARADRVLFLPDRNLAQNTAHRLGLSVEQVAVLNPSSPLSKDVFKDARLIAWSGVCNVHQRFTPAHVEYARRTYPDAEILVHPEVSPDVVQLSDRVGSTTQVIQWVSEAQQGTSIVIGTEHRLVQRLANEHPDKTIVGLSLIPSFCRTMTQVRMEDLLQTLRALEEGKRPNVVRIPQQHVSAAQRAVQHMFRA
jgi:quinolinate synthase